MNQDNLSDLEKEIKNDEMEIAVPVKLPAPVYWPFFLSMGCTFIFWGLLTSRVIVLAGIFIFIVALIGWINILIHE